MTQWDDDDDPLRISRTIKTRLHRERIAAVERRRQRQRAQHENNPRIQKEDDARVPIDETEPRYIQIDEVIALLYSIERHRYALRDDMATLQDWLNGSTEFAEAWRIFTRAGGVTANDFDQFVDGQFYARRIWQKRHLRLIACPF
jgi:integrase